MFIYVKIVQFRISVDVGNVASKSKNKRQKVKAIKDHQRIEKKEGRADV